MSLANLEKCKKKQKQKNINLATFSSRRYVNLKCYAKAVAARARGLWLPGLGFRSHTHRDTMPPVELHAEQVGSGQSSCYPAFIVEAMRNNSKDDGCSTLRHNIIWGKMIRLMPAGTKLPRLFPGWGGSIIKALFLRWDWLLLVKISTPGGRKGLPALAFAL